MSYLLEEDGRKLRDEDVIMERVHSYYLELYKQPTISLADRRQQEETLTLVDTLVSEEENNRLAETPGADELEETIKSLPAGKAPGEDGLPVEADESNFQSLCRIIERFERISGAQLNLAKSVIVPFALERPPHWLQETGCKVLKPGEYITYLGCKFGVGKAEAERTKDLKEKIQRRLGRWANRFLSWTSQVLFLQHVLRAIPIYQFMGIGLHRQEYKQLEAPCRAFLWGTNSDSRPKTSLVSWESITKLKINGGLQLRPFHQVSDALKMKYVGRLMNGNQADWAQMLRFLIRQQVQNRSSIREAKTWTAEECLLLMPSISLPHSETANAIVQSWLRCRKLLRLKAHNLALPGERAMKMRVAEVPCCRCNVEEETVSHLFFECPNSLSRWRRLHERARTVKVSFQITHSLLETIDEAIRTKEKGSPLVFILFSITNAIWKDRNLLLFRGKSHNTPLLISLEQARREVKGSFNQSSSALKWQQGLQALEELKNLMNASDRAEIHTMTDELIAVDVGRYRRNPENEQTDNE
ncbi:hypothetical protein R1flu_027437 [Riccia fluitans]|uniref:Reverse transcriptase zinc-binding domain-containing protein n=1 Tax=Riccia fluitans TaxID=41844 RepID=A0ABD1XJC2_9MARC